MKDGTSRVGLIGDIDVVIPAESEVVVGGSYEIQLLFSMALTQAMLDLLNYSHAEFHRPILLRRRTLSNSS